MRKRLLLGTCVAFLSLSVVGQASYRLAELTLIRYVVDPREVHQQFSRWGDTRHKSVLKWDDRGMIQHNSFYYWEWSFEDEVDSQGFFVMIEGWIGVRKEEITRMDDNRSIQMFYNWNYNTNDWRGMRRIERIRDSNNNVVSTAEWVKEGKEWIPFSKEGSESIENKVIFRHHTWNRETNDWDLFSKHIDEYNSKGQRVLWTSFVWGSPNEPRSRARFYYDENGQRIRQVNFFPRDSIWIKGSKTETVRNKDGEIDLVIFYDWNESTDKWVERRRNDRRNEEERDWAGQCCCWVEPIRIDSVARQHDIREREVLSISYHWDTTNNLWRPISKIETEYDDSDNPIFIRTHKWWRERWALSETRRKRYRIKNN